VISDKVVVFKARHAQVVNAIAGNQGSKCRAEDALVLEKWIVAPYTGNRLGNL
jgi:hypothetical protein